MKTNKMPAWLKKVRENQAEKSKLIGLERLRDRIDSCLRRNDKNSKISPAEIMDLWEEVEKLSFKDLENLKNSLSDEGRDFLENVIL